MSWILSTPIIETPPITVAANRELGNANRLLKKDLPTDSNMTGTITTTTSRVQASSMIISLLATQNEQQQQKATITLPQPLFASHLRQLMVVTT